MMSLLQSLQKMCRVMLLVYTNRTYSLITHGHPSFTNIMWHDTNSKYPGSQGEQEGEDGHELPPLHTGAHRHQDVEQRRPGAYQHVAGVGEAGGGQQVADGDAGECRRVGLQGLVDEAYLQLSVRQHGEPFAEVGDDAVAQRGDEDGAGVADEYRLQNLIFPIAVYPVKGGGHHGADSVRRWQ